MGLDDSKRQFSTTVLSFLVLRLQRENREGLSFLWLDRDQLCVAPSNWSTEQDAGELKWVLEAPCIWILVPCHRLPLQSSLPSSCNSRTSRPGDAIFTSSCSVPSKPRAHSLTSTSVPGPGQACPEPVPRHYTTTRRQHQQHGTGTIEQSSLTGVEGGASLIPARKSYDL